jgi:hypothetical protein
MTAPDAIKAQIARFNTLCPDSKPTKVQQALKKFERDLITTRDNATILSYLLTGDEGSLGSAARYVIRSVSQATIPSAVNDEDSPGGVDVVFYGILPLAPNN